MEPNPPFITKKLCDLARGGFFMIRKGFSKSKLMLDDLQFLVKRGKTMGKALNELVDVANHASLSCRPRDVHLSFVSPLEYEFSCSTSPCPSYQPYVPFHANKRRRSYSNYTRPCPLSRTRDGTVFGAMGCSRDAGDFDSPLICRRGRRRVQIRESPAPPLLFKDEYEECRNYSVDEAAEEFIQRFHNQLRLQKWLAVLEAADQYG